VKSGVIGSVAFLLAISAVVPERRGQFAAGAFFIVALLVASAAPVLAQESHLPPLIINSPEDVSVTQSAALYNHVVSTNDFLVIDDGSADPTISCTIGSIANSTKTITNDYNREASAYGTVWEIPDGTHTVLCTVTDEGGKTSTATHTVSVDVQGQLFPNDAAKQRISRIASMFVNGVINENTYHLIIKYYHRAGFIDFDISRDGSGGFTSSHSAQSYCENRDWYYYSIYAVNQWRSGNYDDVFYKQCLEAVAENGVFDRLNLGF